ncbi:MAG: S1/P1 nuclease [Steroidobacter sp.]
MKICIAVLLATLFHCSPLLAWSRPGHMVTAAIAYEELNANDRKVLERIIALAERHPDRGAFEVAIAGAKGDERGRRIFLELARWSDDIRGSIHDHPTWHYSSRPLINKASPPAKAPEDIAQGSAIEAFALNLSVVADERASAPERAIALSWVFHLVGDMHQPLHSVSQFSERFPEGDRGGGLQFVRDPKTNEPVSLHSYWDDAVNREGSMDEATRRASELLRKFPRSQFKELKPFQAASEMSAWTQESYQLANTIGYGPELTASDAAEQATVPSPRYLELSTTTAEKRLTLASYRLAEVLRRVFKD